MATIQDLADAIIRMEGSMLPNSVNMAIVTKYGMWNVGHLVWAGQRGAVPVVINGRQWAAWPTYEEAYQGLLRQIRLDMSRGMTLTEFLTKYAPPSENQTGVYIRNVSAWTGIDPNARLSDVVSDEYSPPVPPLDYALGWDSEYGAGGGDVGYSAASTATLIAATLLAGVVLRSRG
ncbi:MAG: hypothetical protein ABIN58_00825 [candidate division WOR-3 bacterium]